MLLRETGLCGVNIHFRVFECFCLKTTNQKCLPLASCTAKIATRRFNVFFNSDVTLNWISSLISHSFRNGCSLAGFCYISLTDGTTFGSIRSIYQQQWNSKQQKFHFFPWIPNMVSVHLFFFFLGHTIVVCCPENLAQDQKFIEGTPEESDIRRICGNWPGKTIILDLSLSKGEMWWRGTPHQTVDLKKKY